LVGEVGKFFGQLENLVCAEMNSNRLYITLKQVQTHRMEGSMPSIITFELIYKNYLNKENVH